MEFGLKKQRNKTGTEEKEGNMERCTVRFFNFADLFVAEFALSFFSCITAGAE